MAIFDGGDSDSLPDLGDLSELSLSELTDAVSVGDAALTDTLQRIAPTDGNQLLVAASFQSAI